MLVSRVLSCSSIDRPLKFLRSLVITRVSATYIRAYIYARTHNARIRRSSKSLKLVLPSRLPSPEWGNLITRKHRFGRSEQVRLRFYYRVHRARAMSRRSVHGINREAARARVSIIGDVHVKLPESIVGTFQETSRPSDARSNMPREKSQKVRFLFKVTLRS